MGKWFARNMISLGVRLTTRLQIVGYENTRGIEKGIFVGNHIGRLDGVLVYYLARHLEVILLVAEKYEKVAILRWFVNQLDGIFVDRFNADFTVLREVLRRLKKGGVLAISPEGTRSPNGALQTGWPGASFLALKSGLPVVPVGFTGCEDTIFFPNLRKLRRTPINIRVGKPFYIRPVPGMDREAEIQLHTAEVMCQIAALLPPSYRGVYADHPRLLELLAEAQPGSE
jgi:1-acyl-sn-glycerol-3-phosphate acyltransferase